MDGGISSGSEPGPGELVQEWAWSPGTEPGLGVPAADADAVAFTHGANRLVVLDPASGDLRWELVHTRMRDVAPLLTSELVVVPTERGLLATDRDGARRWEADLGDRTNTPVVAGGALVATTWEGGLVALDPATGALRWRKALGGDALGPPAATPSVVVATWDDGREAGVSAFDVASGSPRWSTALPPDGVSAPAIAPRGSATVVVVAGDAAVHGLALSDGASRWRTAIEAAGSPEAPPLPLAGGGLVVAHRLGGMVLVDPADGSTGWSASSPEAAVRPGPAGPSPSGSFALVLYDGRLLVAGADREAEILAPPSLANGVAVLPSGWLVVTTTQGPANEAVAISGW